MRALTRVMFFCVAFLLVHGSTRDAVLSGGTRASNGNGLVCDPTRPTNCVADPCITNPSEGWSCAMVEPVDHPKCRVGDQDDCCETRQVVCARLKFYGGGGCAGDPPSCPGMGEVPPLDEATRKEAGCDPDHNDCLDETVDPPPGGGLD